ILINEQTTKEDGTYLFKDLLPNRTYHVEVGKQSKYRLTNKGDGSLIDVDSDFDGTDLKTGNIFINYGVNIINIDAGFVKELATLGDFVWNDLNKNGLQDKNEPGIAQVQVKLYDELMVEIDHQLTNTSGYYEFSSLPAGIYFIQVVKPNGFASLSPIVSGNDTLNSDGNELGFTKAITLGQDEGKKDIDFGLIIKEEKIIKSGLKAPVALSIALLSIGLGSALLRKEYLN
ncbi:MAG: SdrD B-like domain-containing protein, partial [Bacilli bacterium]